MRKPLSEDDRREVFRLRCKSKRGETLSRKEMALVQRAFETDPAWYKKTEADVFNATVPFGSTVRMKASDD